MNQKDLRVAAADYLVRRARQIKLKPRELEFTAKEVAQAVGDGYAGQVGHVATDVAQDVTARGYPCVYVRGKPTSFKLKVE